MAPKTTKTRADAVRQAVDQAFQSQTQVPRERIADLVDELSQTAGRLRGAVDDLRPASAEDLKALRAEVRALARRVEALEPPPAKKASTRKAPPKRAPAKGQKSTAAKAGAARRAASERSSGRRTSAAAKRSGS